MVINLSRAYVRLLFGVELVLFSASLLVHVGTYIEGSSVSPVVAAALFRSAVLTGILVAAFLENGRKWVTQIKSCPGWMWRLALSLGVYSLLVVLFEVLYPKGASLADQRLTISAVPIGLDAISICILYSVLWSRSVSELSIVKGARNSAIGLVLGIAVFCAYQAGYLHHPTKVAPK